MAFVTGPRQVGKTTTCRALGELPGLGRRRRPPRLLAGPAAVAARRARPAPRAPPVGRLRRAPQAPPLEDVPQGLLRHLRRRVRIVVTGSSRLDVFKRGGDSLMGRYFLYRMHPFSVAEMACADAAHAADRPPAAARRRTPTRGAPRTRRLPRALPRARRRVSRARWRRCAASSCRARTCATSRRSQDLAQLGDARELLEERSGTQLVVSRPRARGRRSRSTRSAAGSTCCALLHHGFLVRPWFRNVARSLRKEPKWYLRDWSAVDDPARARRRSWPAISSRRSRGGRTSGSASSSCATSATRTSARSTSSSCATASRGSWSRSSARRDSRRRWPTSRPGRGPVAFQVAWTRPTWSADCFSCRGAGRGSGAGVPLATPLTPGRFQARTDVDATAPRGARRGGRRP